MNKKQAEKYLGLRGRGEAGVAGLNVGDLGRLIGGGVDRDLSHDDQLGNDKFGMSRGGE